MADKTQDSIERSGELSLSDALNDLEQMLESQEAEALPSRVEPDLPPLGEQYTIPLLDDIVSPGSSVEEELDHNSLPVAGERLSSIEEDSDCQKVIDRLSSEIEVIVQAGMEEALDRAKQDITEQVKKHIEIILPEILDEIAEIKARKGL